MDSGDGSVGDGSIADVATDADREPDASYDVIVVGAGTGGVAAAIQAARLGATVTILEETDWLGGQMTAAAVTSLDGGNDGPATAGLFGEFRALVRAYYADTVRFPPSGKSVSTCYTGLTTCFEPRVGHEILRQMLDAEGVGVELRVTVESVVREGDRVTGAITSDGRFLASHILIDATEYGDVLPLTGARYRVGRSTSDAIDPNACIQDITYLAVMRRYPDGVPSELRFTEPPPGYTSTRRDDFARFAVAGDGLPDGYPYGVAFNLQYRGMPDSTNPVSYTNATPLAITRTGVNFANDWPGYVVERRPGGILEGVWRDLLLVDYIEDPATRRRLNCEAKLMTLGFLYYWQTEIDAEWSIADDEGYDTPYNIEDNACPEIPEALRPIERLMPVMPYVRESRRLVTLHMLTGRDIFRELGAVVSTRGFTDAVAVGDYGTDLHNCRDGHLEADLGETWADRSGDGYFEVPFEAFIPERIDGFLPAEKNIGQSRLANGATRLQPSTMFTGQAAGAIAGLAARDAIAPRAVDPLDVQLALVDAGAPVARYPFGDVPLGHAYWGDVQIAAVRGFMVGNGVDRFDVEAGASRAATAVVLAVLFGLLDPPFVPPSSPSFDDVPLGHFAYAHVEALVAASITSGCGPRTFCPDAVVTRGQLAVFLATALALPPSSDPARFTDVPSPPLSGLVDAVAAAGLMDPCGADTFCPNDPATRGMLARAVRRTLARR
jgi:hypothetical protein